MGCSLSGLSALYDAVNGGGDVWINQNRFRIVKQLGEGGFAFVYLVKEVARDGAPSDGRRSSGKRLKNPNHVSENLINFALYRFLSLSDDGSYALKKILIQSEEQLVLVKEEIRVSSLFNHPNMLPLLDHAILAVKGPGDLWYHEAYLLFPVYLDGSLLDNFKALQSKKEFFSALYVLQIFRQICVGLQQMHSFDPPYAHNDVKPGNVLITHRKEQPPLAVLMDFGSARHGKREIRSRSEALQLQVNKSLSIDEYEWAAEHCSAPFRAPELWDCPSHADIDARTDIWALGCTLYAIMYGASPFEYALDSGGSLQLAIMNVQIRWPSSANPPFPESFHQFITWMLQPQPSIRPFIDDVILHVDKLILNSS
ncbi:3-phosphoinositide-dependent protein kinase 1 [Platanthera zijinensis]|uniref:non-specific serine/threonine protein kinase n=1 Tax=Platanthera zijinensis TaxID=2320716 RepID=A0AAP0BIV6_9ASPA